MSNAGQFCADLLPLATASITVTPRSAVNNYGEATYTVAGTSYSAYVEKVSKSDRDAQMDDRVIEYRAYIPSTSLSAAVSDQVVTQDGYTRPVIEVDVRSDEFGQQVVVLSLGRPRRY